MGLRDLYVFATRADLKLGETLPSGLGFLRGRVTFVAVAIKLHSRDRVGFDELLHTFEIGLSIDGIGLGGFVVSLRLSDVLRTRAIAGFFKRRTEGSRVGL